MDIILEERESSVGKFDVVSMSNDWGKTQKVNNSLGKKLLSFKENFGKLLQEYGANDEVYSKEFNKRKALPQHWYDLPMESSEYHISLTCATQRNEIGIEVYIDNNKEIYDLFYENKDIIEENNKLKYKWQSLDNRKASRIKTVKKFDVIDKDKWEEAFEWFCKNAIIVKKEYNNNNKCKIHIYV